MLKQRILIVDDEEGLRKALARYLEKIGYEVEEAASGAQAIEMCKDRVFNLVISDLMMPGMSGLELLQTLKTLNADLSFLMMTGFGTIETAVEAIKLGAFHYMAKPFELEDMAYLVEKALNYHNLMQENRALKQEVRKKYDFENFIGCSDEMNQVFHLIRKVADTESNILILGESGTGKELVAKSIHYNSARAAKPMVAVNCAAIPENLLESELFGYMKGAFTGAVQTKEGKFAAAEGGTLFLDEIGDMSLKLQVKLLRVLQEKKYEPVGSTQSLVTNVRIIAATNMNLEKAVKEGRFREDLYYRLNVIPVMIPSLKERSSDIPLLVDFFLKKFSVANRVVLPILSDEVIKLLMGYKWPGNVRELENTIERLVVLKHGQEVHKADLPEKFIELQQGYFTRGAFAIPDTGISLKDVVDDFENALIVKALNKTNWNKNQAASLLQLNRTTLVEKIKKRNICKENSISAIFNPLANLNS